MSRAGELSITSSDDEGDNVLDEGEMSSLIYPRRNPTLQHNLSHHQESLGSQHWPLLLPGNTMLTPKSHKQHNNTANHNNNNTVQMTPPLDPHPSSSTLSALNLTTTTLNDRHNYPVPSPQDDSILVSPSHRSAILKRRGVFGPNTLTRHPYNNFSSLPPHHPSHPPNSPHSLLPSVSSSQKSVEGYHHSNQIPMSSTQISLNNPTIQTTLLATNHSVHTSDNHAIGTPPAIVDNNNNNNNNNNNSHTLQFSSTNDPLLPSSSSIQSTPTPCTPVPPETLSETNNNNNNNGMTPQIILTSPLDGHKPHHPIHSTLPHQTSHHHHYSYEGSVASSSGYTYNSAYSTATTMLSLSHFGKFIGSAEHSPPWYVMRHITTGFRINYNFKDALKSLFELHNETAGIWSHIAGFFCFLFLFFYRYNTVLYALKDRFLFWCYAMYYFGGAVCMLCSFSFHLFCCCSRSAHDGLYGLDMSAINVMIIGNIMHPVYMMWYCDSTNVGLYYSMYALIFGLMLVGVQNNEYCLQDRFFNLRIGAIIFYGASALVPFFHFGPIGRTDQLEMIIPPIVITFSLYGIGVLIWIFKFPEVLAPGVFDLGLYSHGLWHTCILIGSLWTESGFMHILERIVEDTWCKAP